MSRSSTSSSTPQTPAIRTFQFDGGSQGSLASSVNLFRGDVNLTRNLLTLPGRSPNNGLDVSVDIQYQSNVFRQATTWNAEAPTGTLGLGWSLPLTWIEAHAGASPVAATRRYVYHDNGVPNQLFRQPLVPVLFTLDRALASQLRDGAALPAGVVDRFRAHGLAVSAGAVVRGLGPWTVQDDALQQLFTLTVEGEQLVARDGGELYQPQDYQFWKIVYYPSYERWVVVTEEGLRRSFGGRAADTSQGFAASLGNSVAWSVAWVDSRGRPAWSGPSNATRGQVQVARAWYLCELRDRFGSAVTYTYACVEQQVGVPGGGDQAAPGKPHTRAIYLDTIEDSFGRTIRFGYGEKSWDARPGAPREYHDPHRATPSDEPGPYQDRYETRYLDRIEVNNASGVRMYSYQFEYALVNVTTNTGSLKGDTYKRLLTAVTQRDQDRVPSPGLRFTYDLGVDTPGGQPGALLTATGPQGGTVRYTYQRHDLPLCDRSIVASRPSGVPQGATPRVFYGNDYVVVCYYNAHSQELSLQVYTWVGRWLVWSPEGSAVIDSKGLSLATLKVYAQVDFIAVCFNRTDGDLPLYVYQRDTARPGRWRPGAIEGAAARNQPSVVYKAQGVPVELLAGNTFLVVSQMDGGAAKGSFDVLTWRWTTQTWTRARTDVSLFSWVTAGAEWYAVLDGDGRLQLSYLDGALTWRQAALAKVPGVTRSMRTNVRLVPGAALVAVANLSSGNQQWNAYTLTIAHWNADYAITVSESFACQDVFGAGSPALPWTPQVIGDTLVAVNGNLFRRNDRTWARSTALNTTPPQNIAQRFAFGVDCAVRVLAPVNGVGAATAEVVAYDPATNSWTGPSAPRGDLPPQSSVRDNWPSIDDADWLIIGPFAWHRGTSTAWTQAVSRPATLDLAARFGADFDSGSLINDTPGYVAFSGMQGRHQAVQAVTLRNGGFEASTAFAGEKLYVSTSGGAGGMGVAPRGPQVFVSFPTSYGDLDQAQSVTLHRHAGSAVDGPITHYTVVRAEMDDGFGVTGHTSFAPDLSTAAADTTGDIVKFYTNTVYPGAATTASAPFGRVVHVYLNGAAGRTDDDFFGMLDGLLSCKETYSADGSLLESTRSTWTVAQRVASSPTDPSAPAVQLRGGWVAQTGEEQMKDGIVATTTTEFVPSGLTLAVTGQPVRVLRPSVGGDGVPEAFVEVTRHGVEFYASLWATHAFTDVAQGDIVRLGAGGQVLVSSEVHTYRGWPSKAGEGVLAPAAAANFSLQSTDVSAFPFATWSPGQTPAGWTLTAMVTARTRYGQEAACVDALGVAATSIFDKKGEMAVAQIANAAPSECAYIGFQTYEDTAGWTLAGVTYDNSIACAGTRSAELPGGAGASVSVTVRPRRPDTWIVGCRYRTPGGFVPDASGLRATIDLGGGQTSVVTLPWTATRGEWTYVTLPVPVISFQAGAGAVTVTATNTTASAVNIDSILVAPLVTAATLRTFDVESQQITATTDAGGRTSRTFYDRTYRASVSVNAAGLVREISASFLSRRGSAGDAFDPASPNAELTLHSAGGGVLESFRDGNRWSSRWQPAAARDWSVNRSALVHASAASSPLTWKATPASGTYAIYFELETKDPDAAVSVSAGDIQVKYTSSGWSAQQGGSVWPRLASPGTIAARWLFVVGDGVVCFFGDGQLLFSQRARPVGATAGLSVAGAAKLRNLTGVRDIRLGVSYSDACGRQRQVHQLHGGDSLICQLVHDALDRQVAATRCAPGSFGSGAAAPVLAYRPGFVDVDGFLAATASTWEMTGDVADYYRGQTEDGVTRSDDRGYPYRGTRYEASPRAVKLETGLPGAELAINLTVSAAGRKTMQTAYGPNATPMPPQPANQYTETSVTSAVKTVSSQWKDRLGNQVAMACSDASGTIVSRSTGERAYAAPPSGPTATLRERLPNALIGGPQANNAAYVRTTVSDSLQQTVSVTDVDTGTTQFIYDSTGSLRFVQPAMDPGEQWFVYYRYDAIGRRIEEGTVAGPWEPATLRQRADDRRWPPREGTGVVVAVITEYDGNGKDPTLIGMKWRTAAMNATSRLLPGAGSVMVAERFGYDRAGNLTLVAQTVSGAVAASGTLNYAFNALGEVVRLDLPNECGVTSIHYGFDDQGDVVTIGTTAGGRELGAFGYSADRQPQTWSTTDWNCAVRYTSAGWVRSKLTRDAAGTQSFALEMGHDGDGAMTMRTATYAFSNYSLTYADTFGYDEQRRLTSATGGSNDESRTYDPNGNVWTTSRSGKLSSFPCEPGTDRPQSASVAGGPATPLVWNARGQLTHGLGRSLEYVPATGLTRVVTAEGAALALSYGASQQRVVKQDTRGGRVQVYFSGSGQVPVAICDNGSWGVMVHGPMGPLAWISGRTHYLLTDTTRSVWGVVADGALRSATAWTPFGAVGASYGAPGVAPLGFHGQERDREIGLHNFGARLYDPVLCRFLAPDPRRQFASPYVFAANNPLNVVDPTGEISVWAAVGIGAAMVALIALGVGAGVAAGALAAGGTAAAGTTSAAIGGGGAAAASSAASSQVVIAGISVSAKVAAWGLDVVGSTMIGAGVKGLQYDLSHGRDFTAAGFFEAVGIGAAGGFAQGAVCGALTQVTMAATQGMSVLARTGAATAIGATGGVVNADVQRVLLNASNREPWYQGLARSTVKGAMSGGGAATAKTMGKSAWEGRTAIATRASEKGIIRASTVHKVATLPELAKELATTQQAYATYVVAGFFVVSGYTVWGSLSLSGD